MNNTWQYHNFELRSHFQPIYSLAHRRCVGLEALIRTQDGNLPCSPLELFAMARARDEEALLDQHCQALHLRNYAELLLPEQWLFINVCPPSALAYPDQQLFWNTLNQLGLAPQRMVMEIIEHASNDPLLLEEQVREYRTRGALVAIDDFGAGHSNFDRIWRLQPDIVKLDRSLLVQAREQTRTRHVLGKLIQLIHGSGALAVMEGVETLDDLHLVFDSGADMVQGFGLAYPAADPRVGLAEGRRKLNAQLAICARRSQRNQRLQRQQLERYTSQFTELVSLSRGGTPMHSASEAILRLPGVQRCYLLDQDGYQLSHNMAARQSTDDGRFRPMQDALGASWSRRHYFKSAIAQPGQVQVSDPYLSVSDGSMCLTLSCAFNAESGRFLVLCCDLHAAVLDQSCTLPDIAYGI
ncbi:EAL domain-containing protein [Pokkaliibacter plantistimulans]|nr:EAL domain-containing protein [Pokkaliibacter plantistimulans]